MSRPRASDRPPYTPPAPEPLPPITNRDETLDADAPEAGVGPPDRARRRGVALAVTALAAGAAWGVAAAHFDLRWSWPVLPAGVALGWAWGRFARGPALGAAALTAALFLTAVAAGSAVERLYPSPRMIQQQPAVLRAAVHLWMQRHGELPAVTGVGRLGDDAAGDLGDEIVTASDIEQLVRLETDRLSPAMRRTVLSWYHSQPGGRAGLDRGSPITATLWLAAAAGLAWRLAIRTAPPKPD
ncbi:MAG: hypothetical protein AAF710_09710 [Planctomycetota bacterium]